MKLKKELKLGIVVVSLLGLLVLNGCVSSRVTIYPIKDTDIILLEEGQAFVAPQSGAFLSDFYLEEISEAKIDQD